MASTPPSNSRDRNYLTVACSYQDSQQESPDESGDSAATGAPGEIESFGTPISPLLFAMPTSQSFLTPTNSMMQPDQLVLANDAPGDLVLPSPQLVTDPPVEIAEESVTSTTEFYKSLPRIGALNNPARLCSFVVNKVAQQTATRAAKFKEENPSWKHDTLLKDWTSSLVEAIGNIVPPFGLHGAGYLGELIKQLLRGEEFVLSPQQVLMLQLAFKTSSDEMCDELVRIATARGQESQQMMHDTQTGVTVRSAQTRVTAHSAQTEVTAHSPDVEASFEFLTDIFVEDQTMLHVEQVATQWDLPNNTNKATGKSAKYRKDGNIRGPYGTLSLTRVVRHHWTEFVSVEEGDNAYLLSTKERSRLRSWLYKALMKIGGEAVLREGVYLGICSKSNLLLEADRWEATRPNSQLGEDSRRTYHLRPKLLRFLAQKCTSPDFELIVAKDENLK